MINLSLTGWSDHDSLVTHHSRKLEDYAGHFPVVEMDTSFYAIPSKSNILSWIEKTPDNFSFIPKAYAAMTQHKKWNEEFSSLNELFDVYKTTFEPMIAKGKIKAFLFQFPPFFEVSKDNVNYLREVRRQMGNLPIVVEFRNPTWFSEEFADSTFKFLEDQDFIHMVVDQPQTPNNSVPFTPLVTNPEQAIVRLHGRNYQGWLGGHGENWRKVRTLYNYSEQELKEIKDVALKLEKQAKEVTIIFNNNSGGHAAPNAKTLQKMLGIEFENLAPRQLGLFDSL